MTVEALAPAKINLTLHVTGQRPDGYHLLDSLVAFAEIGDRITVKKAAETQLSIFGPFAADVPDGPDNLIRKAAGLMAVTADIRLEKNLPVAAGIGGGSSDAAATLKALSELYDLRPPDPGKALSLGADVPVCLTGGVVRMQGIGEALTPLASRLHWPTALVNPGVGIRTGSVFSRLKTKLGAPMREPIMDQAYFEFPDWLARERNDLEPPAISIDPVIRDVLDALRAEPGCRIARMSGSGATCFALFDQTGEAEDAVASIRESHPSWWSTVAIS